VVPAVSLAAHESRPLEDAQVLGHGRQRHLERLRELRDGRWTFIKTGEDSARSIASAEKPGPAWSSCVRSGARLLESLYQLV
jgi:hypothetical protein